MGLAAKRKKADAPRRDPDVVFLGAGPSGLMAATQMKLRKPDLSIVMLEKHDDPARDNRIWLDPRHFQDCKKDAEGLIDGVHQGLRQKPTTPINDVEKILRRVAENLDIDIRIIPDGITDIDKEIVEDYPNAKLFIGSDGAKSKFRGQIYPEKNFHREVLQYAAHVKYTIEGEVKPFCFLDNHGLLARLNHHLTEEDLGKAADGKTPAVLTLFTDAQTHAALKDKATFKTPVFVFSEGAQGEVPPKLREDVESMIGARMAKSGTSFDPATVRLSVTEIPQQFVDSPIQVRDGKLFVLLGDSALALSFRKGANAGLESANRLAQAVVESWDDISRMRDVQGTGPASEAQAETGQATAPPSSAWSFSPARLWNASYQYRPDHPLRDYEAWFKNYASEKIQGGRSRKLLFNTADHYFNAISKLPYQVTRFTAEDTQKFREQTRKAVAEAHARAAWIKKNQ